MPTPTPAHYVPFYRLLIRFAVLMLVLGGLAGVLFQELTKSIAFADLGAGPRLEAVYHLALLHGHAFLIGAVMPVCWLATLHLMLHIGCRPVSRRALKWIVWTYLPGAVSVVSLICYKGLFYVARVKDGERDFDAIHAALFGGNKLVRGLAYGLSHTVATVGLVVFGWVVWRSLATSGGDGD